MIQYRPGRGFGSRSEPLFITVPPRFEPRWRARPRAEPFCRPPDQCPDRQFNDPHGDQQETYRCIASPPSWPSLRLLRSALRCSRSSASAGHGAAMAAAACTAAAAACTSPHRGHGGRVGHPHPAPPPALARALSSGRSGTASARSVTRPPRPVAGPCTCLSKEYTADGRGAVQGSLHQRGGDESAARRSDRCARRRAAAAAGAVPACGIRDAAAPPGLREVSCVRRRRRPRPCAGGCLSAQAGRTSHTIGGGRAESAPAVRRSSPERRRSPAP